MEGVSESCTRPSSGPSSPATKGAHSCLLSSYLLWGDVDYTLPLHSHSYSYIKLPDTSTQTVYCENWGTKVSALSHPLSCWKAEWISELNCPHPYFTYWEACETMLSTLFIGSFSDYHTVAPRTHTRKSGALIRPDSDPPTKHVDRHTSYWTLNCPSHVAGAYVDSLWRSPNCAVTSHLVVCWRTVNNLRKKYPNHSPDLISSFSPLKKTQ